MAPTLLRVDASARRAGSHTRRLTDELVAALAQRHPGLSVTTRDLADGILQIDEAWIGANLTPAETRSPAQAAALALSDRLIAELWAAEILVLAVPIYNFGVPAALKAWIDQICRARVTFRYGPNGPVGLLEGKKAYVVIASGGTAIDGPVDFATGHIRQVLRFIGITDVEVIAADRLTVEGEAKLEAARSRIAALAEAVPDRAA